MLTKTLAMFARYTLFLAFLFVALPASASTLYEWGAGQWYSNPKYTTNSGAIFHLNCNALGGDVSVTSMEVPLQEVSGSSTVKWCTGTPSATGTCSEFVKISSGGYPVASTTWTFTTPFSCSANSTTTIWAYALGNGADSAYPQYGTSTQYCDGVYGSGTACPASNALNLKLSGTVSAPPSSGGVAISNSTSTLATADVVLALGSWFLALFVAFLTASLFLL